jgi:hypothetical protein
MAGCAAVGGSVMQVMSNQSPVSEKHVEGQEQEGSCDEG